MKKPTAKINQAIGLQSGRANILLLLSNKYPSLLLDISKHLHANGNLVQFFESEEGRKYKKEEMIQLVKDHGGLKQEVLELLSPQFSIQSQNRASSSMM